jgi:hypothetical protein
MAVTEEVMAIVRILDEEGFGELAGDLLQEISAGRRDEDHDEVREAGAGDVPTRGVPFTPQEQMFEVMRILRLVEPARHLAEAERIAANLSDRPGIAIRFVDPEGLETDGVGARAAPGEQRVADELEALFRRIAFASRQGPI